MSIAGPRPAFSTGTISCPPASCGTAGWLSPTALTRPAGSSIGTTSGEESWRRGLDRVDSVPPERRRDHGTDADRCSDTYRARAIASSLERRPHRTHTLASDTVLLRWCVGAAAAGIVRDHQCLHPFCGLETQLARLFAHEMSSSTVSGGVVDEGAWWRFRPHRHWQHAAAVIRSDRVPLRRPRRGLWSIGQSGSAVDRGTAPRPRPRLAGGGEHEAQRDLGALISGSEGSAPEPRR
jgi:hypothetical protein